MLGRIRRAVLLGFPGLAHSPAVACQLGQLCLGLMAPPAHVGIDVAPSFWVGLMPAATSGRARALAHSRRRVVSSKKGQMQCISLRSVVFARARLQ